MPLCLKHHPGEEPINKSTMFEAKLSHASILKKILDAIKDLVTDANFDCSANGISLQAMDSSHVSLVALLLRKDGFDFYRCDRNLSLGINLGSMAKILKCAGNDDRVTIRAEDSADVVTFIFESKNDDKILDFELKLLNIESDVLGIPDQQYNAVVSLSATDFQKICRDMTTIGDTVVIAASKEGVKFSVSGELGTGNILLKKGSSIDAAKDEAQLTIDLSEPVALTFALRYLNFFAKATSLSSAVSLSLAKDVPLVTEYRIEELGYVRFYLAPKIEDDSSSQSQQTSN